MNCREAKRLLEREFERGFEGELRVEERFSLNEHVESCATCRSIEHAQRVLIDAIELTPPAPIERLDIERSLKKIHASIDEQPKTVRPTRRVAARPSWLLVAAAVLALLAGALAWSSREDAQKPKERKPVAKDSIELMNPTPLADHGAPLPLVATATEEESLATPEPSPRADEPVDRALLTQRRSEVSAALMDAREVLHSAGSLAFARAVDRKLEPLAKSGWPVDRIILGLARDSALVGQPRDAQAIEGESTVPSLALRYLGRRATRTVIPDLVRALSQRELARAAISALADAGTAGRRALAPVVWDSTLGAIVLARVLTADPMTETERVAWVRSAFRFAERERPSLRTSATEPLLEVLSSSGEAGARALVALHSHPCVGREELLDALAACPAARAVIADHTTDPYSPLGESFLLRAIEKLTPPSSFAWTLERCANAELRLPALFALAEFQEEEVIRAFLRAKDESSNSDRDLRAAFDRSLRRNADSAAELARRWSQGEPDINGESLFALLIESESEAAVPALLQFVLAERASFSDRELALLAVSELASADHQSALVAALARMSHKDRGLAAELLVTIRIECGTEVVAELFATAPERERARALELIERCTREKRRAPLLFQLARYVTYSLTQASLFNRS